MLRVNRIGGIALACALGLTLAGGCHSSKAVKVGSGPTPDKSMPGQSTPTDPAPGHESSQVSTGGPSTRLPAHAAARGSGDKHQYYYYPQAEVYRDCEVNQWFWIEGGRWRAGAALPKHIILDVDGPVAVHLDADSPVAHHNHVLKMHPKKQDMARGQNKHPGKGRPHGLANAETHGRGKDKH